jgi:hypothetical protein
VIEMGEAIYYLIAEFPNKNIMDIAIKILKPIFKQTIKCQDEWQKIRGTGNPIKNYEYLMDKYPLVNTFLDIPKPKRDDISMNDIAGTLDINEDYTLYTYNTRLELICEVWHFADWSGFVKLMFKLGASYCNYYSDEYTEDIVNDINIKRYSKPKDIKSLTEKEKEIIMVEML